MGVKKKILKAGKKVAKVGKKTAKVVGPVIKMINEQSTHSEEAEDQRPT